MSGCGGCARTRGQAIAEFAVALLMLLPLWWWVQYWQQGQAQRTSLVEQARHASLQLALEGTVDAELRAHSSAQVARGEAPGLAGIVMRTAVTLIDPVEAISPGSTGLDAAGWSRTTVSAPPPPGPFWRDIPGPWSESLTLYAGDWSVERNRDVERRTQALLPATPLEWALDVLAPVRGAIALLEPTFRATCPRRVVPDIVPTDRLAAPATVGAPEVPGDGWRPAC